VNRKQKKLLAELAEILDDLAEEAVNDEDFNFKLAEIGIWKLSVDEMAAEIREFIREECNS